MFFREQIDCLKTCGVGNVKRYWKKKNGMSTTESDVKRTDTKDTKESALIESDRVGLIEQANKFVELMVLKEVMPVMASSVAASVEYTEREQKTYDAALSYLERQFTTGHADPETYTSRSESERSVEHFDPEPEGTNNDSA